MLRDHEHRAPTGPRRFIVLHGASYGNELGYREELTALAERRPETVAYLPTVSRPENARNADWAGARGRVESQVAAAFARFGLTPANTAVFACGHPEMVRNVAGDCRRRGFTAYTEAFD
jgi:NAD(P)H-flavin reductase